jgi:hypothetical protein
MVVPFLLQNGLMGANAIVLDRICKITRQFIINAMNVFITQNFLSLDILLDHIIRVMSHFDNMFSENLPILLGSDFLFFRGQNSSILSLSPCFSPFLIFKLFNMKLDHNEL